MSLPTRISTTGSYREDLPPTNQQPTTQIPTVPINIVQNALHPHAAAADLSRLTISSASDLEESFDVIALAENILTPSLGKPRLQDVLDKWTQDVLGDRVEAFDFRLSAARILLYCTGDKKSIPRLSYLRLTSVPDVFNYPQLNHLQVLDLEGNQLSTLPESIGQLTALKLLDLRNNQLTALPTSIGQLTALEELDAYNNRLTMLPNSFCRLTALRSLNLVNNFFSALPESTSQLTALREILLHNNPLRELPCFLRTLNLEVYDLPFAVNIESITEEIYRVANVKPSEALKQFYVKATDGDDGQKALLRAWIDKLKDTAPGKTGDVHFYKSVAQILELASTNALFAETFWIVIADAATICGDKIALSILDLDIEKQLMTLDPQKHLQVADFLKRDVWTYNLLKTQAINKILELRAEINHKPDLTKRQKKELIERIEEMEIYLGYFIKLKEALNLPITLQRLLYLIYK